MMVRAAHEPHVQTLDYNPLNGGVARWFEPIEGPGLALWWVPAGQIPTVAEALDRLEHLKVHGPTRKAFTFRTPFAPPDMTSELAGLDAEFCEWPT